MFYFLIPLFIIIASAGWIIFIIVRRFPQLSLLEVEKLKEVKQAKIKEDLKKQRFIRALAAAKIQLKNKLIFLSVFGCKWVQLQTAFRQKVGQAQIKYKKAVLASVKKEENKKIPSTTDIVEIGKILRQADEALERGDGNFAERKYIEVIKNDKRNIEAYRGLGKVYMDMEKYQEAEETFKFLLKLSPRDDRVYNRLAMLAQSTGDLEKAAEYFERAINIDNTLAIRYYDLGLIYAKLNKLAPATQNFRRAVKIEPNNPKYLDQLLKISIICRDIELAKETLAKLKEVNPENQVIIEYENEIENFEDGTL